MTKTSPINLVILSIICLLPASSFAEEPASNFQDAIKSGKIGLDFRMRNENVDQGSPADKDANAGTLKTRLNYKTQEYKHWQTFFEIDNVSVFDDSYNDTINGNTDDAVVVDPKGTEVNQAWLSYDTGSTLIKYGRQRILLDNQRFLGGVGWRQNEQTYDAFTLKNTSFEDTTITLAQINNVNRIFGKNSIKGDTDTDTKIVNVSYQRTKKMKLTGYVYLIDNTDAITESSTTVGARFSNSVSDFDYTFELASQSDAGDNPTSYSALYYLAEGKYHFKDGPVVWLGVEALTSDNGVKGFETPLATLHKFQGWADQFLATPTVGIVDTYVGLNAKLRGFSGTLAYHTFSSDEENTSGDSDLGSEWDFVVSKKVSSVNLMVKYASYQQGDNSFAKSDTRKIWLTAAMAF